MFAECTADPAPAPSKAVARSIGIEVEKCTADRMATEEAAAGVHTQFRVCFSVWVL